MHFSSRQKKHFLPCDFQESLTCRAINRDLTFKYSQETVQLITIIYNLLKYFRMNNFVDFHLTLRGLSLKEKNRKNRKFCVLKKIITRPFLELNHRLSVHKTDVVKSEVMVLEYSF